MIKGLLVHTNQDQDLIC